MKASSCLAGLLAAAFLLQGCAGVQSALDPSGEEAERIGSLTWLLTVFSSAVFAAVLLTVGIAIFGRERWRAYLAGEKLV
ncbi:MAG: cytochrome C oxidase subunit II, partial [Rhizobiaceae bacterium]|nr:cytochrome C oxidase subunit II [Rhizobiaceae bacterium]